MQSHESEHWVFENYALSVIDSLPPDEGQDPRDDQPQPYDELLDIRRVLDERGELIKLPPGSERTEYSPSGEEPETISTGLELYGLDYLAFYKSPHFLSSSPFPGFWGIFVLDWGVDYVRQSMDRHYPGRFSPDELWDRSLGLLRTHELFHFRVDAWALAAEATLQRHLYRPYMRSVYRTFWPDEECVEESLANGFVLAPRRFPEVRDFSRAFIGSQPGAYGNPVWPGIPERQVLAAQLIMNRRWHPRDAIEALGHWVGYGRDALLQERNCPVRLVVATRPSQFITPAFSPPDLAEFRAFVTGYLSGELQHRSDHELYRIDNGASIKMPNPHGRVDRLKPHEFKNSLRKAGLKHGEYRRERSRTAGWRRNVPRSNPIPPLG